MEIFEKLLDKLDNFREPKCNREQRHSYANIVCVDYKYLKNIIFNKSKNKKVAMRNNLKFCALMITFTNIVIKKIIKLKV